MNTFGRNFRLTIAGESHGLLVAALLDGVPAGMALGEADVQPALDRRRPGQSALTTQRQEADAVVIRSGVHQGRTTGAALLLEIANTNQRSQDYEHLKHQPRPGHSDYPATVRYHGHHDPRGGGMFSGRLTAAWVMAGAVAAKVLDAHGIQVAAHTTRVGSVTSATQLDIASIRARVENTPVRCADADGKRAEAMIDQVENARRDKDSVGGIVTFRAEGVPAGWGNPLMASLEAQLSSALYSVPAVKGVAFGDGFDMAAARGTQVRDEYARSAGGRIVTRANHNGGILGGISTGMPIDGHVAFKPTSSIPAAQDTLDTRTGEAAALSVKGRHDPCIVPRAVPVVESVVACVLLDALLERHGSYGAAAPFQTPRADDALGAHAIETPADATEDGR